MSQLFLCIDFAHGKIFGPLKDQCFVNDLLEIIYQQLHLRQFRNNNQVQKSINYELGLCTGPCRGAISEADYTPIAQRVRDFLRGDESHMVNLLTAAMNAAAAALEFEKAAAIKKQINFCRAFAERQRFISRFRTSDPALHNNNHSGERCTFVGGRLVSAYINGCQIKQNWIEADAFAGSDARFVLGRANIVYGRLKRQTGFDCAWG